MSLASGESVGLSAVVSPDGVADKSVVWSSSDGSVASVDADGKVRALKSGVVTITATSNADPSVSGVVELTVSDESVEPVSVDGGRESVTVGGEVTFTEPDVVAGFTDRTITKDPVQGRAWLDSVHYSAEGAAVGEYPFVVSYTMRDGQQYLVTYTAVVKAATGGSSNSGGSTNSGSSTSTTGSASAGGVADSFGPLATTGASVAVVVLAVVVLLGVGVTVLLVRRRRSPQNTEQ